jgi:hypothetical protein
MKSVYRVLAFLVALGVVVQAAAIAYGVFGLLDWVSKGGTIDKSTEPGPSLGGYAGLNLHGTAGIMIIPAIALLLLISSFFAKIPGGIKWALIVFAVTVIQVALGIFSHELAGLGWLHGANALILFGLAVSAAMRVRRPVGNTVGAEPVRTSVS